MKERAFGEASRDARGENNENKEAERRRVAF